LVKKFIFEGQVKGLKTVLKKKKKKKKKKLKGQTDHKKKKKNCHNSINRVELN